VVPRVGNVAKFKVQFYSKDRRGHVYTESGIEANRDVEAVAIAAEMFIQRGAQITASSSYDVIFEKGGNDIVHGADLRHFLKSVDEGQFPLLRSRLGEVSNT